MNDRRGYDYHYGFSTEDEIIPRYEVRRFPGVKSFLFEIRTNFIIKRWHDEDQIIDSERFDACVAENDGTIGLDFSLRYRLEDYWMSNDQIRRFIVDAYDYAKTVAVDPCYASLHIIPVVVGFEVCTVQQENESLRITVERSISAEKLVPLYLSPHPTVGRNKPFDSLHIQLMIMIPRIRVENVDDGLDLMEVCCSCSKKPSIGSQISVLRCHHAFHSHCLIRSLEKSILCPVCHSAALPLENVP